MPNKIEIIGNVGRDPELRYTTTGKPVFNISIGSSSGKDDKRETTWYSCVAFDETAEGLAGKDFKKGDFVQMTGRPGTISIYTKKDGTTGASMNCVAHTVAPYVKPDESSS